MAHFVLFLLLLSLLVTERVSITVSEVEQRFGVSFSREEKE